MIFLSGSILSVVWLDASFPFPSTSTLDVVFFISYMTIVSKLKANDREIDLRLINRRWCNGNLNHLKSYGCQSNVLQLTKEWGRDVMKKWDDQDAIKMWEFCYERVSNYFRSFCELLATSPFEKLALSLYSKVWCWRTPVDFRRRSQFIYYLDDSSI